MKLTAQAVDAVVMKCLFRDDEPIESAIMVQGIGRVFGFHPERVVEHGAEIRELLAELPDAFHADKGGGWSFLNACLDRHGHEWTGEHRNMECLFCLGIAVGAASWVLPRSLWAMFPGGMPYVAINVQG